MWVLRLRSDRGPTFRTARRGTTSTWMRHATGPTYPSRRACSRIASRLSPCLRRRPPRKALNARGVPPQLQLELVEAKRPPGLERVGVHPRRSRIVIALALLQDALELGQIAPRAPLTGGERGIGEQQSERLGRTTRGGAALSQASRARQHEIAGGRAEVDPKGHRGRLHRRDRIVQGLPCGAVADPGRTA